MAHIAESEIYKNELERVSHYAQAKIDLVLKDMIEKLLVATPDEPIDFMINYLTDYKEREGGGGGGGGGAQIDDIDNDSFNEDAFGASNGPSFSGLGNTMEKSDVPVVVAKRGRRRTAISAEPVQFLSNETYTPVVVEKSSEQRTRIREAVSSNILFSSLGPDQLKLVVDTMIEKKFSVGNEIIRQGEEGDYFYVLDSGEAECFVNIDGAEPMKVKEYTKGESFGELALMYNSPRAATIKAKTDVVCWAVDRITFRRVLMDTTSTMRRKYEEFLSQVKILQSLDRYERARVADVLRETEYKDGDYVITQGERGDMFYIVVEGKAKVTKCLSGDINPVTVLELGPGDYFGELALLNDDARAANVIAVGPLRTVTLDRASFVRLLGPVDHILKRNKDNYEAIEAKIYDEKIAAVRGPGGDEEADQFGGGGSADGVGAGIGMGMGMAAAPASKPISMRRRRTAVSSEPVAAMALGGANEATPVIPKTPAQAQAIKDAVAGNFLFQGMDEQQQKFVINAMFEKQFEDGAYVIKQGEPGDNFYVLAEGTAECFVQKPGEDEPVLVKTYKVGESFGELALMYNSPRAASIRAKGPIRCWAMNRVTFRRSLMNTTNDKRKMYEGFLSDVEILSSLDRYERAKVADALVEKTFEDGDYVIRQDEPGDNFYIVVDGEAIATKKFEPDQEAKEVMRYKRGDYFGELALLNDKPRAANVVAQGRLTVVTLDRSSFVRLLGPCDEILKRNTSHYAGLEASMEQE